MLNHGWWLVAGAVLVGGLARPAIAQTLSGEVQLASRGPAFYSIDPTTGTRADARNAAVLRQAIAVSLTDVSIPAALEQIGKRSGLKFAFQTGVFPATARVSLSASHITVEAALTVILLDAGLDVELLPSGFVGFVARPGGATPVERAPTAGGSITGLVTDSSTGATIPYVIVRVDETGQSTQSSAEGRYTITGVAPGQYRVTARRVGFIAKARPVIVEEGKAATLNFALNQPPTKIDEVVTTAVGDQRRYTVGTSIATINVDSIAPTAPVLSLTDLISSRAPGVEVLETSGLTGAGEAIRIRGLSSLVLQNDPILIVDGVRQDNSAGGDIASHLLSTSHPTPTRLNDLDFNDIETVDILKGPAASTEYGTDAANGVIVITTKRGTAGRPRWHISAEQTESDIPVTFPNNYYSWGHTTDGTHTPVDCLLATSRYSQAAGTCVVDSVTQWNPLNHAATSIFGTGTRGKYDLSVSGGSDAVRYFVSGGLSNETGIVRMPQVFKTLADTAHLGLPRSAFSPNSQQQRSGRVNTSIRLGPTADLNATASYLSTYQQTPDAGTLYQAVLDSPGLRDAAHYYGYDYFGQTFLTPIAELSNIGSQSTARVTGGLTANWRPVGWFVAHATAGIDHGSQREQFLTYPFANPAYQYYPAGLGVADATNDIYSADVRGTATASPSRGVRAITSVGLQMVDTRTVGQSANTFNITSTNLTLNGAPAAKVSQQATRQATLGGYGEEQLAFADQLFLTGAVRIDAASGFGYAYNTAAYPKASVSWLAVNRGPTSLRVRGAFGESGVQPTNGASLLLYAPNLAYLGGSDIGTNTVSWPGNPNLRPERSAEFEGGIDFGGWGNRLTVELTGYEKTTHDALVNVNLGATLGNYTYQENIGEVRNTGVEGTVTAGLIQTRSVTWDVTVNASANHNTLLSLAPGVVSQTVSGNAGIQYRQAVGYPLYGLWARKVTYADANHDGILEPNEVTIADSASFMGSSVPTREASVSTHIGLFGGAVTVGALVDYRGGYRIANPSFFSDYVGNTQGTNDPHAPLWKQARAIGNIPLHSFNSLDVEDGSFVRFRELSATYAAPQRLVRALRVQSLSVTAAVRNLALWTRYTGADPEASNNNGANLQYSPLAHGTVNNDVRSDNGAVPLARYWVMRLNVGI